MIRTSSVFDESINSNAIVGFSVMQPTDDPEEMLYLMIAHNRNNQ